MRCASFAISRAAATFLMFVPLVLAAGQDGQMAESTLIKSGDAQLYLEMRGPATRRPILLYLHGGPGEALGIVAFRA